MNEVEKMYENAEVEPKAKCNSGACIVTNPSQTWCKQCESLDYTYPPFNSEKQLELIKWLLQNKRLCIRKAEYSNNFYMDTLSNRLGGVDNKDFEQCLASLMNNIWQSLTEDDKQQIKEILE